MILEGIAPKCSKSSGKCSGVTWAVGTEFWCESLTEMGIRMYEIGKGRFLCADSTPGVPPKVSLPGQAVRPNS